jgi:hypothetical protein
MQDLEIKMISDQHYGASVDVSTHPPILTLTNAVAYYSICLLGRRSYGILLDGLGLPKVKHYMIFQWIQRI